MLFSNGGASLRLSLWVCLSLLLSACGGKGGSQAASTPATTSASSSGSTSATSGLATTAGSAVGTTAGSGGALTLTPASAAIIPGATDQVTATGGTSPYTYYVVSGTGTIDPGTGVFTAPAMDETDEVAVQDSAGDVQFAIIAVSTSNAAPGTTPGIAEAPVYRFYNATTGEHFFSLSSTEVGPAQGFILEQVAFDVFVTEGAGMTALYRCLWTTVSRHFISTSPDCEGWTVEGIYGYVYVSQTQNSTLLYRSLDSSNDDHLETTSLQEAQSPGYQLQTTLGYVPTK